MSHEYAEENYGRWTNRLLDACRIRCKREGGQWYYVQVTERQKRLHPHSHFITTFAPSDFKECTIRKTKIEASGKSREVISKSLRSDWLAGQIKKSGLGEQYEITRVQNAEAASRYVAKYLFKPTIFRDDWPKGWKRIRYSQSFPKSPDREGTAIVLLGVDDWFKLAKRALFVTVSTLDDFTEASNMLHFHDTIVRLKSK